MLIQRINGSIEQAGETYHSDESADSADNKRDQQADDEFYPIFHNEFFRINLKKFMPTINRMFHFFVISNEVRNLLYG